MMHNFHDKMIMQAHLNEDIVMLNWEKNYLPPQAFEPTTERQKIGKKYWKCVKKREQRQKKPRFAETKKSLDVVLAGASIKTDLDQRKKAKNGNINMLLLFRFMPFVIFCWRDNLFYEIPLTFVKVNRTRLDGIVSYKVY